MIAATNLSPWLFKMEPEADPLLVAEHNLNDLSLPILVACRDEEQLEEFIFRENLLTAEVRRFVPGQYSPEAYHPDKILLLLPCWEDHEETRFAVENWVYSHDRYTVALDGPWPPSRKHILWLWILAGIAIGILAASII